MALSININVNNSDISIKNSKTGAKKNIKSISAGNLNDMKGCQKAGHEAYFRCMG